MDTISFSCLLLLSRLQSTFETQTEINSLCRHTACAAYLLEQGADAFAVDKAQRRSAIHYAVLGPQPGVLKMLVSDDAKIHTEDGRMPLRDVRVHDMSGQCRYGSMQQSRHPRITVLSALWQ